MEFPAWEETTPIEQPTLAQPVTPTEVEQGAGEALPSWENTQTLELTPSEKVIGGLEAFGRGLVSRPVVAAAERVFGVSPEEAKRREAGLGGVGTALELTGLAGPALATLGAAGAARLGVGAAAKAIAPLTTLGEFTQAGLLTKAGQAAVKGLGVKGAVAAPAVAMGIENALFAVADETAKAIEGNPNNAQKALYNVALSGALGTVAGGAVGKVGDLWKTKYGPKYKGFFSDLTGRLKDHQRGAVAAADAVGAELQSVVDNADDMLGSLAGAKGLKQQEIQKILPAETTAEMIASSDSVLQKTDELLSLAKTDPVLSTASQTKIRGLEAAAEQLAGELSNPNITPFERWSSLNKYKQTLDRLKIWESGQDEAVRLVREARTMTKKALEDSKAWGLAGQRQAEINKAVSKWKENFKYVKSLIGNQVGGKNGYYVINPDKINTIINQAKKGKAAFKQNVLSDFLDATEQLFKTADDVNTRLGLSVDYSSPQLTASRAVTEKLTPGMKAADLIYDQAINTAATGAGGYVGYKAGKMTGLPGGEWAGALFGSQALEPIIKKVLPVLIKPMTGVGATANSVRAASQLINAVANGENLSKLAADSLFLKDKAMPFKQVAQSDLDKIDKKAREVQSNPESLLELNDDLNQVLPNQGFTLANASMTALSYINSKRPGPKKNGLLDKEIPPSPQQMANFRRTLEVAENPLVIMKRIKDGTLRSSDVVDLKNMYPNLYDDMLEKMFDGMVKHTTKGQRVPYKVQKYLSLYAGKPLEMGLTPQSIQAAQATYQPQAEPQGQELPQMAPKSSRKSQLPKQTQTDQQRRILKE